MLWYRLWYDIYMHIGDIWFIPVYVYDMMLCDAIRQCNGQPRATKSKNTLKEVVSVIFNCSIRVKFTISFKISVLKEVDVLWKKTHFFFLCSHLLSKFYCESPRDSKTVKSRFRNPEFRSVLHRHCGVHM